MRDEVLKNIAEGLLSMDEYDKSYVNEALDLLESLEYETEWVPIGGIENNRAMVEQTEDGIQAISELISNSEDAYLLLENKDKPEITREEALEKADSKNSILLQFSGNVGRGKGSKKFSISVADTGIGVENEKFEESFFSDTFNTGKTKKKYNFLSGMFGQGSLAPLDFSEYGSKLVISSHSSKPQVWSWSITRYNKEKNQYEYLLVNGEVPKFEGKLQATEIGELDYGTITKVYNYSGINNPSNATNNKFVRELEKRYPDPAYPIILKDSRLSDGRIYQTKITGIEDHANESDLFEEKIVKKEEIEDIGEVKIKVLIPKSKETRQNMFENGRISSKNTGKYMGEFFTSTDRKGILFCYNGQSHHILSNSYIESKCDYETFSNNTLVIIDCSNVSTDISNIFKSDRTRMKDTNLTKKLRENVYETIKNTNKLQKIEENRVDEINKESPLKSVSITNLDTEEFMIDVKQGEEVELDLQIEGPRGYLEKDFVSINIIGYDGDYTVNESEESVTMKPNFKIKDKLNLKVAVKDNKLEKTVSDMIILKKGEQNNKSSKQDKEIVNYDSEEFDIDETKEKFKRSISSEEVENINQVWRAKSGDCFEKWVKNKLEENLDDKNVFLDSELDSNIEDKIKLNLGDNKVYPDADIVICDDNEVEAIVSCKTTLRERAAQTVMWRCLTEDYNEESFDYVLVTTDSDDELRENRKWKKVLEYVLDNTYITNGTVPESETIKEFNQIYTDL